MNVTSFPPPMLDTVIQAFSVNPRGQVPDRGTKILQASRLTNSVPLGEYTVFCLSICQLILLFQNLFGTILDYIVLTEYVLCLGFYFILGWIQRFSTYTTIISFHCCCQGMITLYGAHTFFLRLEDTCGSSFGVFLMNSNPMGGKHLFLLAGICLGMLLL